MLTLHVTRLATGQTISAQVYTHTDEIYTGGAWAPFDYPALANDDIQRINAHANPSSWEGWDSVAVIQYAYNEGQSVAGTLDGPDDQPMAEWHFTLDGERIKDHHALRAALADNVRTTEFTDSLDELSHTTRTDKEA